MRHISALFTLLMPGCGQIYNGQIIKGIFFLIIEHYDNAFGKINKAIYLDLNGLHHEALNVVNFQYLLFYPGFYAFCTWDAWFHAKPDADKVNTTIPFYCGWYPWVVRYNIFRKITYAYVNCGIFNDHTYGFRDDIIQETIIRDITFLSHDTTNQKPKNIHQKTDKQFYQTP
jgi:hypothetical protein